MSRLASALMCTLLSGCFNLDVVHSGADSYRGNNSKIALVQSTETSTGGISATVSASSTMNQLVSAPEDSAASGSRVVFPPGSLVVDTSISIEESAAVATDAMSADLELNTSVQQAGVAIMVKSEANVDAMQPFSLAIPLPVSTGLAENNVWDNLIVMYRVKVAAKDKTMAGIIPRSDIVIEGGMAKFSTQYFGAFQTALTETPVLEKKEVETNSVIVSKAESLQLPAIAVVKRLPFVINANKTVQIQGSNFRATMIVALGGKKVGNLQVLSDSVATFVAPEGASFGLTNLSVEQDGVAQSVSVFYAGASSDYPIITEAENEVCSGKKYYDANGVLKTGSKSCSGTQADLSELKAENIISGITINGVAGTAVPAPANCAADNAVGCVTTASYPSVAKAGLAAGDIRSGVSVAGISGTLSSASYSNCSSDGQTNCIAVSSYPAANATGLAAKVLTGQTVANVAGSAAIRPSNCAADGATNCVADSSYPAAQVSGLAAKVLTGQTVANVAGTAALSPSSCASDGATNCVATSSFPAVDSSLLTAGNIKVGVTLGGITGQFPSGSYPLNAGDGFSDLDSATFNIQIKQATTFGWFDRNGVRHSQAGDADLMAGKIKSGMDIFGETGTYGPSCSGDGLTNCLTTVNYKSAAVNTYSTYDIRKNKTVAGVIGTFELNSNGANFTTFNRAAGIASSASTTSADPYDSTDDYNNNGAMPFYPMPSSSLVMGWFMDAGADNGAGGGTSGNGICDGTEDCVYKDLVTNRLWARSDATTRSWEDAISYCDALNYGGQSGWRIPTQKEAMQAYVNAIWYHKASAELNLTNTNYWTATTYSPSTGSAWSIKFAEGALTYSTKTSSMYPVVCVQ